MKKIILIIFIIISVSARSQQPTVIQPDSLQKLFETYLFHQGQFPQQFNLDKNHFNLTDSMPSIFSAIEIPLDTTQQKEWLDRMKIYQELFMVEFFGLVEEESEKVRKKKK